MNSTIILNYTKEDFSEHEKIYSLFFNLIKNHKHQYIPYFRIIPPNKIIRKNLPDNQRFNSDTFTTDNTIEDINIILQNGIMWLYQNLWSKNYIHGDLTSDNLILIKNQLYFIDWKGTAEHIDSKYKCLITIFILSDIIDYLNSFYKRFPTLFQIPEFDDYYNIIKEIESEIKTNSRKCDNLYFSHTNKITDFIYLIHKIYDIPTDKFNILGKRMHSKSPSSLSTNTKTRKLKNSFGGKSSRYNHYFPSFNSGKKSINYRRRRFSKFAENKNHFYRTCKIKL